MGWTHLRDELGRSRKVRVCQLCGRKIQPATRRVKRYGVYEGKFETSHMHVECEAMTHDWDQTDWDTHVTGDGEWPEVTEEGGEA